MKERWRNIIFWSAAIIFLSAIIMAFTNLTEFGNYKGLYGNIINKIALPQRHTAQSIAAVNFDYRGFDTLGEEYIFFTAVTGTILLLRIQPSEHKEGKPSDKASDRNESSSNIMFHALGSFYFMITFLTGLYIILHGHLTPGGGFQGGVLTASAFVYIYIFKEYKEFKSVIHDAVVEFLEIMGAAGFVIVGLIGLLKGTSFLANFLPYGQIRNLFSTGTILVLNLVVGLEISCGCLLFLSEFLQQTILIRKK